MTAPAIAQPTNAPAPTSPDVSQSGPFGVDDALASISRAAIDQTIAEQTPTDQPTGEQPRGPDGKFVPKATPEAAPVEGEAPPTPETVTTGTAPETEIPELPDGFVAVAPVKDRELATAFKVLDAEGELDVPDVTIEFNANGKTRREPLDKVVRLAERGVYNEEREQAVLAQKQHVERTQSENQQLRAMLTQTRQQMEQLLSSDDAYLLARAQFEQENSPEARLQRVEQQRAEEQRLAVYQQARNVTNQYFETSVLPAVQTIADSLSEVTADEIGARLVLLTNHLRVPTPDGDTMIPPAAHQAVGQIILNEIVPWARDVHESRDSGKRAEREQSAREKQDAARKANDATIAAQKAKNLVGRQTRPRGSAANTGTATREAPPEKPIKTVDDAEAAALKATLASMI